MEILTEVAIAKAVSTATNNKRIELMDAQEPGLRLRVGPRKASWSVLVTDHMEKRRRIPLGAWPEVDLAQARWTAAGYRNPDSGMRSGEMLLTVSDLLARYEWMKLRDLRRGSSVHRSLTLGLRPLLTRSYLRITRRDISEAIQLVAVSAPIHANRILAYTKAMFSWAVAHGLLEANPAQNVPKPVRERSRDRTPTLQELALIFDCAEFLEYPFCHLIRLMILTACRREEVGAMRVRELHLPKGAKTGEWMIPPARTKNGRALKIPLSPLARRLVEQALDARPDASPFVFTTTGVSPVSGWSKVKRRLDDAITGWGGAEPLEPWRFHDFRRSFATIACEVLNVRPEVADRCLNHVGASTTSTIARVYARHQFFPQRKMALEKYASLIEEALDDAPYYGGSAIE
ncbi:integrase family protein [Phenylobacterium sp.]|uniref:tyrosine-type recombinase/integrase n=1 Tax=Phenylobacterium sp. TaxID=1871053 RepID=UPI0027342E1E|nr:integrase family protein [Phenylobacterium sp.]MDP3661073.1 integrase family protein [Phenylobacterium sp.]